jgi:hypothetical protein
LTESDADILTTKLIDESERSVVLVPNDKHADKIKKLLSGNKK